VAYFRPNIIGGIYWLKAEFVKRSWGSNLENVLHAVMNIYTQVQFRYKESRFYGSFKG
jgi:hypothetical protein